MLNKRTEREEFEGCILILLHKRNENESPLPTRCDLEGCVSTLTFRFVSGLKESYMFSHQDFLSRNMISRYVPPLSACINRLDDTFSDFLFSYIEKTGKAHLKALHVKAKSKFQISLVDALYQQMMKESFIFGILLSLISLMDSILTSMFPFFFDLRNRMKTYSITDDSSSDFDFAKEIGPPYISHKAQAGIIHVTHPMSQADPTHVQQASLPVPIPATGPFYQFVYDSTESNVFVLSENSLVTITQNQEWIIISSKFYLRKGCHLKDCCFYNNIMDVSFYFFGMQAFGLSRNSSMNLLVYVKNLFLLILIHHNRHRHRIRNWNQK